MKKALLLCVLAVFSILQVMAQDRTITGTITSKDDGTPLPGVTVRVKGTNTGAQADGRGNYAVKVSGTNPVLVFSFVGYEEQIVSVGSNNVLNVKLSADQHGLNEVVVVGYGTKAIKDITGATGEVKGAKLAQESNVAIDQALAGKTAGVQMNSASGALGDGVSVHVRGINSLSMSSSPLFVIDGVPLVTEGNIDQFNGGNGTRFNPLALINPNDIESITVLKDAGATVIYGSRGANGVIMVTTKKGKLGTAKVSVDSKAYWSQVTASPKLLNATDFMTINNEKEANAANKFGGVKQIAFESDIDGDGKNDRTDWMKEVYNTTFSHDNNISMSGGSDKATYYGSARFSDQKGAIYGNTLKLGQIRLNFDVNPTKWFKSGLNLSYTKAFNQGVLTDRYLAGATVSGYNAFPTVSVRNPNNESGYNLDGNGLLGLGNNIQSISGTKIISNSIYNIIANTDLGRNNNTTQHLIANAYGEIQPIRGLKLTSKIGVDFLDNFEDQFSSPYIAGLGLTFNGLVQDYYNNTTNWVWSNFVNFDRTFGQDHHISFTGGEESQFSKRRLTYAGASDFADPFFKDILDGTYTGNDNEGNLQLWSGGGLASYGLQSYFGRVGYSFKDKYLIEGAYRQDAFSAFGEASQWGHFPSVSAGWIISQEEFLKPVSWINFLKLRASYGKTGNSRFNNPFDNAYAARTLYGGGLYASENGLSTAQSGNSSLRWETSNKLDVGADFNIYDNRLRFVVDYFRNDVSGLLLDAPVLATVGIPGASIQTNIGSMYNHGIEFTVNANTMTKKDFTWTTSFNFTYIKNRVTGLVTHNVDVTDALLPSSVASVGHVLGEYKQIRWAGVDPETGNASWLAKDGTRKFYNPAATGAAKWTLADKSTTSAIGGGDAVYTGKTGTPKFYGGLDNTFNYKNFDLNISFVYTGGFYIYNATRAGLLGNYFNNNSTEILSRWTTPGQKTDIPKTYLTDNIPNQTSTRFLEKGDYLRCRTISLGYTFRQPFMNAAKLNNLRVYAQVYNPFVFTGYSGPDPEVSYSRNTSNIALAVDNRQAPQLRTFTLGLNVGF